MHKERKILTSKREEIDKQTYQFWTRKIRMNIRSEQIKNHLATADNTKMELSERDLLNVKLDQRNRTLHRKPTNLVQELENS